MATDNNDISMMIANYAAQTQQLDRRLESIESAIDDNTEAIRSVREEMELALQEIIGVLKEPLQTYRDTKSFLVVTGKISRGIRALIPIIGAAAAAIIGVIYWLKGKL